MKPPTKRIKGKRVLDSMKGDRFYHRALSPKAQNKKKAARQRVRKAKRRNR